MICPRIDISGVGGKAMSLKLFISSLGCVLAWMVLLPIGLIGGGVALFTYALFAEIAQRLIGVNDNRIDPPTARRMALQMLNPRHARFAAGI
jgi:hypothetical protein